VIENRFDNILLGQNFWNPASDQVLPMYTAATALPANWFVRLSEFEAQLRTQLDEKLLTEAQQDNLELNLSPLLDFDTFATVMEGLDAFIEKPVAFGNETQSKSASTCLQAGIGSEPVAASSTEIGSGTVEAAAPVIHQSDALASLFDPVRRPTLEKMYPGGQWEEWIAHASANGLCDARESYGKYNPYKAGMWLVARGKKGWNIARVYRVLVNNLPARSHDKRDLLIPELDYLSSLNLHRLS
jgi:hypothetical protein